MYNGMHEHTMCSMSIYYDMAIFHVMKCKLRKHPRPKKGRFT